MPTMAIEKIAGYSLLYHLLTRAAYSGCCAIGHARDKLTPHISAF